MRKPRLDKSLLGEILFVFFPWGLIGLGIVLGIFFGEISLKVLLLLFLLHVLSFVL